MIHWFKSNSEIATADRVMNQKLGGTSILYMVASASEPDGLKEPERLRYVEALQREIEGVADVGKTSSAVDLIKRINRVLRDDRPQDPTDRRDRQRHGPILAVALALGRTCVSRGAR